MDERLREIIESLEFEGHTYKTAPKAIAQIKQAFAEEGWCAPIHFIDRGDGIKVSAEQVMTGQEWYDRFEKEIRKNGKADFNKELLEAAKKAAGLEK